MWKSMVILAMAASLSMTNANAQTSPRLRAVGDDVRFALRLSASDSEGPMTRYLSERGRTAGDASMTLNCDESNAAFWDRAARWIALNTREVRPGGTARAFAIMTQSNNLRGMIVQSEAAIAAVPRHEFLRSGERVTGTPADRAADLRQRAEWTAFLSSSLAQMGAAQSADPQDFGKTYGLTLWTRAYCRLSKANLDAARAAFAEGGYPDAARTGSDTENAFILLVRAGGNGAFAASVLAAAGDTASPAAGRVLGGMSAPPAPPQ